MLSAHAKEFICNFSYKNSYLGGLGYLFLFRFYPSSCLINKQLLYIQTITHNNTIYHHRPKTQQLTIRYPPSKVFCDTQLARAGIIKNKQKNPHFGLDHICINQKNYFLYPAVSFPYFALAFLYFAVVFFVLCEFFLFYCEFSLFCRGFEIVG